MIHRPYNAFWGEMSAFEHFVQIYDKESVFLDTLADFLSHGLTKGEAAVAILTPGHKEEVKSRLAKMGVDLAAVQSNDQLILLDAKETISKFMVNDWPDEKAFIDVVTSILRRAQKGNRKVRAFGEMVALMWAEGQSGATVRLEHLWNNLCKQESLPLFCAYPKTGFTEDPTDSLSHVCALHSKILPG